MDTGKRRVIRDPLGRQSLYTTPVRLFSPPKDDFVKFLKEKKLTVSQVVNALMLAVMTGDIQIEIADPALKRGRMKSGKYPDRSLDNLHNTAFFDRDGNKLNTTAYDTDF